ncbi:AmmeMemoRadiSam system protein B [Sesbania bispinosa]|nr:AmmeMemoRadiSam system protein B [Sesbania bispinosa]
MKDAVHVSKDKADGVNGGVQEVQEAKEPTINGARVHFVGPSSILNKRVGLNIKSQVRFKNIKTVELGLFQCSLCLY